MRILIDIGHPGHVHLFKNFAKKMQNKGNEVLFTCREKEFEIELLRSNGFKFISFGKKYKAFLGKLLGLIVFDYKMLRTSLKFKPDIYVSSGSMYAAQVASLLRKPNIALEDSENIEQIILYKPFSKIILTPSAIPQKYGKKQIRYEGFHQSAYLHPDFFKKDDSYKLKLGADKDDKIFLLRLVALNASHDFKIKSINKPKLLELIKYLETEGKVFISSEKQLDDELKQFKLKIPPEDIHKFMSVCDLIVGESGAMTNEAAYLGVPNVLVADVDLNVHKKYVDLGLKIHYKNLDNKVISEIENIVKNLATIKKQFSEKSQNYINDSINLTNYLVDIVESTLNNKL